MASSIQLPKHWEDWASWLLGFWLLLSPWTLNYSDDAIAMRTAVLTGFALIFVEVVTLSVFRPWEEWADVLIGAWLIAAPFVMNFVSPVGTANAIIVGALVMALALYELWQLNAGSRSGSSPKT